MHLTNMITAVDLHACGEPGRVITGGVLDVPGKTMFEKMKYFENNLDDTSRIPSASRFSTTTALRAPRRWPPMPISMLNRH